MSVLSALITQERFWAYYEWEMYRKIKLSLKMCTYLQTMGESERKREKYIYIRERYCGVWWGGGGGGGEQVYCVSHKERDGKIQVENTHTHHTHTHTHAHTVVAALHWICAMLYAINLHISKLFYATAHTAVVIEDMYWGFINILNIKANSDCIPLNFALIGQLVRLYCKERPTNLHEPLSFPPPPP